MGRIEKVNELIKKEVSRCLPKLIGEDIGFITILKADVSKDLKKADIWVSILADNEEKSFETIKNKTNIIQREIADEIELKYTPKIELHLDKSIKYASHIEKLLHKIKEDDNI